MMGGNLGAAVQMLKVINQQGGGSQSIAPFTSDMSYYYKDSTRSGLTLPDSLNPGVNDATILLPYYKKVSTYAYVYDNGALDIGASSFTLCGWMKSETTSKATYRYLLGKLVAGTVQGRYGIYADITTGYLTAIINSSGGAKTIASTIDFTGAGWVFVLMDVNIATSQFRFFVNNVQIGSDTAFTGTFAALDNMYRFFVGSGSTNGTGAATLTSVSSHSDTLIYNRILTPAEMTNAYTNRIYPTDVKAYYPFLSNYQRIYDASGNNYHLTSNSASFNTGYAAEGSRHGLDYGYTRYSNNTEDEYIPLTFAGAEVASVSPNYLSKDGKYDGSLTKHNLCNSYILFTDAAWDRSNATIYSDFARDVSAYHYDSTQPKAWHVNELNNRLFYDWLNTDYKGTNFVKITDKSYITRKELSEIFTYGTNKTGSDYSSVLSYTGDEAVTDYYEDDYCYWKAIDDTVLAVNGLKLFKFSGTTVSLSTDGGTTWGYSKVVAGLSVVQFAYIFDSGVILFADKTKIYRSTDNLVNVTEITPTGIDGNPFSATNDSYALFTEPSEFTIGSTNMLMWGNYSVTNLTEYVNINVWCTINEGAAIKSVYKADVTDPPNLAGRHIHGLVLNPNDSKVWIWTGDGTDECNIIAGTYTELGDTWAWAKLYGDNDGSSTNTTNQTYYKIGRLLFSGTDVVWVSDSNGILRRGIYKCPYADFSSTANYVNIFQTIKQMLSMSDDLKVATIDSGTLSLILTIDAGVSYKFIRLYGCPASNFLGMVLKKDSNGYYYVLIKELTETYGEEYKGKVLKIKLKET